MKLRSLAALSLTAISISTILAGGTAQAASADPAPECGSLASFYAAGNYEGTANSYQIDPATGERTIIYTTKATLTLRAIPEALHLLTMEDAHNPAVVPVRYVNSTTLQISMGGWGQDINLPTVFTCADPSRPGVTSSLEITGASPGANTLVIHLDAKPKDA
jgi:hypothetical protein